METEEFVCHKDLSAARRLPQIQKEQSWKAPQMLPFSKKSELVPGSRELLIPAEGSRAAGLVQTWVVANQLVKCPCVTRFDQRPKSLVADRNKNRCSSLLRFRWSSRTPKPLNTKTAAGDPQIPSRVPQDQVIPLTYDTLCAARQHNPSPCENPVVGCLQQQSSISLPQPNESQISLCKIRRARSGQKHCRHHVGRTQYVEHKELTHLRQESAVVNLHASGHSEVRRRKGNKQSRTAGFKPFNPKREFMCGLWSLHFVWHPMCTLVRVAVFLTS